jgi:hypothetical protein
MANRTKVTQQKRARERAKQERMQEKTRRREEAKTRKASEPQQASSGDEDPDIAGISPALSQARGTTRIWLTKKWRNSGVAGAPVELLLDCDDSQ